MASWEDARRCPRCEQPGEVVSRTPASRGNTLVTLRCKTELCRWFNTDYGVQIRPDGTVPDPDTRPIGQRPLPDDGGRTEEILNRQLAAMKKPGAEMPKR